MNDQAGTTLGDLFGDENSLSGLEDLFPEETAAAEAADPANLADSLGASPESGEKKISSEASLEDLFGSGEEATLSAPEEEDLGSVFADGPVQHSSHEKQESKPERRPRPPVVLGQLSRPTRTLELKGKPVFDRQSERKKAERLAREKAQEKAEEELKVAPASSDLIASETAESEKDDKEFLGHQDAQGSHLTVSSDISEVSELLEDKKESDDSQTPSGSPSENLSERPGENTVESAEPEGQITETTGPNENLIEEAKAVEEVEETSDTVSDERHPEETGNQTDDARVRTDSAAEEGSAEVTTEETHEEDFASMANVADNIETDNESQEDLQVTPANLKKNGPEQAVEIESNEDREANAYAGEAPESQTADETANQEENIGAAMDESQESLTDLFGEPSQEENPNELGGLFEDAVVEDTREEVQAAASVEESGIESEAEHGVELHSTFQEQIAEAEAASALTSENLASLRARVEMESQERRFERTDALWDVVDRIISLISSDPATQTLIKDFELTRDPLVDKEQMYRLRDTIQPILANAGRGVSAANPEDNAFLFEMLYDEIVGISVLGPLWRDENVTEILVDGWDKISVESNGILMSTRIRFRDQGHANQIARSLAGRISDRAVSKTNPLVTAELPRARVQFAYGAVVRGGLSITIRKFRELLSFERLLEFRSLTPEMAEFLKACVLGKANILVSGGTGTGKTTIINLLSGFIPDTERVVTIEDSFELELRNRYWVPLQTKEKASADDAVSITQDDLLRAVLRMRPDRVIVGEVREAAGAQTMIQAANTGHEGTMTTIHANSGESALNERLANLLRIGQGSTDEAARASIVTAFQLVVQVSRSRGKRYISEISVVDPSYRDNGIIHVKSIYRGSVSDDGEIRFEQVGKLDEKTELVAKLHDAGVDYSLWS